MKLKPHRHLRKLPEMIEPSTAGLVVNNGRVYHSVRMVGMAEMERFWAEHAPEGIPVYFSVSGQMLYLHPTPDQGYEARLRYCPAMKEI